MEPREVIRRLRKGQGIRRIHGETGIHRTILRELRVVAEDHAGWSQKRPCPANKTSSRPVGKVAQYRRGRIRWRHPGRRLPAGWRPGIPTWSCTSSSETATVAPRPPCGGSCRNTFLCARG